MLTDRMTNRPALATLAVNDAEAAMRAGGRINPAGYMALRGGRVQPFVPLPRILADKSLWPDAIGKIITLAGPSEICLVGEYTAERRPGGSFDYHLHMVPTHPRGHVLIYWESRSRWERPRMFICPVWWVKGVAHTRRFRELEIESNPSGQMWGHFDRLRSRIIAN